MSYSWLLFTIQLKLLPGSGWELQAFFTSSPLYSGSSKVEQVSGTVQLMQTPLESKSLRAPISPIFVSGFAKLSAFSLTVRFPKEPCAE